MAWASPSGWGLSDLVSTVGETLKQYESVVDQAMGVPATKAGKKEETASASTPPSRAEPDTVDVVIPDADAAFMAPRTPSPPPVQAAPQPRPSPSSSQMRSPAPSRPQQASADFSLEDLLGSPFGASTAANATPNPLSGAAPAASVLADPLRLFGTFLASPAAPAAAPTPTPLSISAVPATPAAPVAPASPAPVAALPSSVPALSSSPPSAPAQPPSPRPTPSDTPAHPHTPAPAASSAPVAAPAASSPERLPSPVAHSPALSDWPGLTPTPAHTPALTPAAATAAPSPPPALSLPTPTPIREATPPPAAPAAAPQRPPAPAAAPDDEVRRLREALMQRERQLETLNAAGAALQDTNAQLLAELERERLRHTDLDRMAGEFGGRITELERRLAAATRERDALRKERETSSAGSDAAADELNKARGEVAQLRAEGEALSRRQLALEEAAKKNRKRMKEDEATIGALNERVRSMEALLETKAERLKVAEENNRKYDESVGSLRALNESLTKRLDERTRAAEAAQAQLAEAQAALEKSWRELAEQRRLGASAEERTESVSKETEAKLREEARSMLAKQERDFAAKEADLHQAMLELRATIARNLERAAWREDELRKELADVQQRMQEAQAHTQELKALNAESTRPLLRQIDALQQSHLAKQQVWDQLETSLTARVHEAEERAQLAVDKERAAVAALNELSIRVRSLESQLGSERGNAARLAAELDLARSTADEQLKAAHARQSQAEVAQRELDAALRDARSREARLQQEARDAALRAEARVAALEKRIADGASAAPSVAVERSASGPAGGAVSPAPAAGSAASVRRGPSETSLVALGGSYGLAPALEKLQAVASQREGEIASLQEQLGRVERERSALAEELVSLTTKVSQLQAEVSAGQNLRTELAALKQRHTAALELLGEKEEKLDELKADLVDMKQLYRSQITEMVEKNAQLATQLEELKKEKR